VLFVGGRFPPTFGNAPEIQVAEKSPSRWRSRRWQKKR
jgi:hypothetical protein